MSGPRLHPATAPRAPVIFLIALLALLVAGCGPSRVATPNGGAVMLPAPGKTATAPRGAPAQPPPTPGTPRSGTAQVLGDPVTASATPRTIVHEVGPLETVWRLSQMYGVPQEEILRANNLKPGETILIGQRLSIPNTRGLKNVITLYPNTRWKYIVIHHTATDIGKASLIHSSHQGRGFWQGLGYHFLIDNGTLGKGDGQIEASPRWVKQQEGAHTGVGGMNGKGIGVALVGNFDVDQPTTRQMESLALLVKMLMDAYHIPPNHVIGHRDVPGARTDCPGNRFPWAELRRLLKSS